MVRQFKTPEHRIQPIVRRIPEPEEEDTDALQENTPDTATEYWYRLLKKQMLIPE